MTLSSPFAFSSETPLTVHAEVLLGYEPSMPISYGSGRLPRESPWDSNPPPVSRVPAGQVAWTVYAGSAGDVVVVAVVAWTLSGNGPFRHSADAVIAPPVFGGLSSTVHAVGLELAAPVASEG
jgi:hypothetical protein